MLSSYLYCKRKLFLEKVLKLISPERVVLVKGSIRHEVFDKANKKEEEVVKSITENEGFKDIYDKYIKNYTILLRETIRANKYRLKNVKLPLSDAFKQTWPFFIRESRIRAENLFNFAKRHDVYGEELWHKLIPKIKSEYKVDSDELLLRGIVDQVEVYEKGIVPVELKTGSMPKEGVWPGHRIQIGAYALLLEQKHDIKIKEGFVHYLDSDERRHIAINPFLKEEVLDLRKKVIELLKNKKAPIFCKNERKCAACGLKDKCYDEKFIKTKLRLLNKAQ